MAYFAAGKVTGISVDPEQPSRYYAHIANFEEFDELVPWRLNGVYWENALRDKETQHVGVFMRGRSVREISREDFAAIMQHGSPSFFNKQAEFRTNCSPDLLESNEGRFEQEVDNIFEREVTLVLSNQKLRDIRFRQRVLEAYEHKCAFTGLCIKGIEGQLGLEAAHILSVQKNGPDTISNGLALTHTAHLMFDQFLLAIDDEYKLLISDQCAIPDRFMKILKPATDGILLPRDKRKKPSLGFIRLHREAFWAANTSLNVK